MKLHDFALSSELLMTVDHLTLPTSSHCDIPKFADRLNAISLKLIASFYSYILILEFMQKCKELSIEKPPCKKEKRLDFIQFPIKLQQSKNQLTFMVTPRPVNGERLTFPKDFEVIGCLRDAQLYRLLLFTSINI